MGQSAHLWFGSLTACVLLSSVAWAQVPGSTPGSSVDQRAARQQQRIQQGI